MSPELEKLIKELREESKEASPFMRLLLESQIDQAIYLEEICDDILGKK